MPIRWRRPARRLPPSRREPSGNASTPRCGTGPPAALSSRRAGWRQPAAMEPCRPASPPAPRRSVPTLRSGKQSILGSTRTSPRMTLRSGGGAATAPRSAGRSTPCCRPPTSRRPGRRWRLPPSGTPPPRASSISPATWPSGRATLWAPRRFARRRGSGTGASCTPEPRWRVAYWRGSSTCCTRRQTARSWWSTTRPTTPTSAPTCARSPATGCRSPPTPSCSPRPPAGRRHAASSSSSAPTACTKCTSRTCPRRWPKSAACWVLP